LEDKKEKLSFLRHMVISNDLRLLWATPVFIRRFADNRVLNEELERAILELQRENPSEPRSGYGGWQSPNDLFSYDRQEIEVLRNLCAQAIADCIAEVSGGSAAEVALEIFAWANVLQPGGYHTFHIHPHSHFSGVYYVRAGEPDLLRSKSGVLSLYEPRAGGAMGFFPGLGFGEDCEIFPEDGMLVLFPSFLGHSVHPFTGSGRRITVAFNTTLCASPFFPDCQNRVPE
jgi:uncharacterized protein (TIGR02466 family)